MNFKRILAFFLVTYSCFWFFVNTYALEINVSPSLTGISTTIWQDSEITRKDFFLFLSNYFKAGVPKTYSYIDLNFKDVWLDKDLKESLQILVYLDIIENKDIKIFPSRPLNANVFYNFIDSKFDVYANPDSETENQLKQRNTKESDLTNAKYTIEQLQAYLDSQKQAKVLSTKQKIFTDVYETLLTSHYDKDKLSEDKLIDSAIDGLTKWTNDKFTTYFPPTESKTFEEDLNGKYEWIWAYVDMEVPWEFKIISPISWTPAELSWLKWWDIVLSVDWKEVTKENTLKEVVSWVKWPAWTKVVLKVKRWEEILNIEITRARIVIKEVEYKEMDWNIFYIQIKTFWDTVKSEFVDAIDKLKEDWNVKTIILDLRNNPWGYLDQVTDMLSYFVPLDMPTAVVKYRDYQVAYKSRWYDLIDFSKYKIIILQNWWTASASEIMIWTIKDYYPNVILVWEKTYWKWSVQTIKPYTDGSALKYTIAKWFTWKTETWIDAIGISPTVEEVISEEKFKEWIDTQMQKALELAK